jgi:integrase
MSYTVVRQAWRRYCQAAGVEATIHQLRHSCQCSESEELVRPVQPLHARCWLSARERSR